MRATTTPSMAPSSVLWALRPPLSSQVSFLFPPFQLKYASPPPPYIIELCNLSTKATRSSAACVEKSNILCGVNARRRSSKRKKKKVPKSACCCVCVCLCVSVCRHVCRWQAAASVQKFNTRTAKQSHIQTYTHTHTHGIVCWVFEFIRNARD